MTNGTSASLAPSERPYWTNELKSNPLPWLLDDQDPAVKHMAMRRLLDLPEDDPEVRSVRQRAMNSDPIAAILAYHHPDGYWVEPEPYYKPKYRGTVWSVMFLHQLGADGQDRRIQNACEFLLTHAQTSTGAFSSRGPQSPNDYHCLNGNLLRAFIGFGLLDDPRVQRAIEWQARSITGDEFNQYYSSGTTGPGFRCAINEELPCGWGAIKAMSAFARIPPQVRAPHVERAIQQGVEFLFSRDPAEADYPMGWGNTKPSSSWFKLGFPSGYIADFMQNVEVLCELGYAGDSRLRPALKRILSRQNDEGRWKNRYAYNGKTWVDFERQGQPSKWVTLRACSVIKLVADAEVAGPARL